jgi:hypothetical protein
MPLDLLPYAGIHRSSAEAMHSLKSCGRKIHKCEWTECTNAYNEAENQTHLELRIIRIYKMNSSLILI